MNISVTYFSGDSDNRSPAFLTRKFPVPDNKPISVKSSFSKISTTASSNSSLNRVASHQRVSTAVAQPQLPGLKAAFGPYTRTRTDMRQILGQTSASHQAQRPAPEFAHNRSFELRLKQTETLIAEREKQQQQQQQPKQQRKWVSRKLESRQSSVVTSGDPSGTRGMVSSNIGGSELRSRVEQSVAVSRLAESNRMAVFRSVLSRIVETERIPNTEYIRFLINVRIPNTK